MFGLVLVCTEKECRFAPILLKNSPVELAQLH